MQEYLEEEDDFEVRGLSQFKSNAGKMREESKTDKSESVLVQ